MPDVGMWAITCTHGQNRCLLRQISSQGGIDWLDDAKDAPEAEISTYAWGDLMLVRDLQCFRRARPLEGTVAGTVFCGAEGV